MKANQKIVSRLFDEDRAVSPVIAVILMVAITVVLAATVYVWVSGFSSTQSSNEQASASAKGGANSIRVILTQAGQSASSNAYAAANYNLYVDGVKVISESACGTTAGVAAVENDLPATWSAGQPLIIKGCSGTASSVSDTDLASGDRAVTVEVAGTAIYDGLVKVT